MTALGPPVLRLLIAEDEPIVRSGLRMLLDAQPDLVVAAEAADGREAVRVAAEMRPDIVLMDLGMPVLDGIAATRQIVGFPGPRPRVLVLTTFSGDDHVHVALRAGADGFVLKRAQPSEIAEAVRIVGRGDSLVLPAATRSLIGPPRSEPDRRERATVLARLTPREEDVLRLVGAGMSNREIAAELFLGMQTVKTHVAAVLAKLGARDRTQAVIIAYRYGFIA